MRGEPRYTMLVTIQEFARTRLRAMDEETKIRHWHVAYFLDLAENGDQELRGPNQQVFHLALQYSLRATQTVAVFFDMGLCDAKRSKNVVPPWLHQMVIAWPLVSSTGCPTSLK